MLPKCESLVSGTTCLYTFITFTCTVTFLVTAASGLVLILSPEEPNHSVGSGSFYSLIPAVILLSVALATTFLAVFGCAGVLSDGKHKLLIYAVVSTILAVLTLSSSASLLGFSYGGAITHQLNVTLWNDLRNTQTSDNTTMIIMIQKKYDCCGVTNSSDWFDSSTAWDSDHYPSSCTHEDKISINKGCLWVLINNLRLVVDVSCCLAVFAALLQHSLVMVTRLSENMKIIQ